MRTPRDGIRRILLRAWLGILLHRLLLWFGLAALLLPAATGISLALSLPARAFGAFFLLLCSLLPAILLWPIPAENLLLALRRADRESAIEAWLEGGSGPARELVARRAFSRLEELSRSPPPRESALRPLLPLYGAAAIALILLQIASFIATGKPTIVYSGPPLRAGSGLRIDERSLDEALEEESAAARAADEELKAEEAFGAGGEGGLGEGQSESRGLQGAPALDPKALAEREAGKEVGGPTRGDGEKRGLEQGEGEAEGAEAAEGPESEAKRARGSERREGGATGFEDGGAAGQPSPLLDYRSRFFKVFAERTRREAEASGELSLAELRDYQRRYFDSFKLSAGLAPIEEGYATLLKRRWRELRGGLR